MLKLVEPSMEYDAGIRAYRSAFLRPGASMDGGGSLIRFERTGDWLEHIRRWSDPATVPEGMSPAAQYICVREEDGKVVGILQIRRSMLPELVSTGTSAIRSPRTSGGRGTPRGCCGRRSEGAGRSAFPGRWSPACAGTRRAAGRSSDAAACGNPRSIRRRGTGIWNGTGSICKRAGNNEARGSDPPRLFLRLVLRMPGRSLFVTEPSIRAAV